MDSWREHPDVFAALDSEQALILPNDESMTRL